MSKLNVKRWQTLLTTAGFNPGAIDGKGGPKTDLATIAFKKTVFKNPKLWDSLVGPRTLTAMYAYLLMRRHKPKADVKPIINIPKVLRRIDTLVIHYTASADVSAATINKWHKARGWNSIGYHFVVRRNGKIERGRNLNIVGAHVENHNAGSVGIVLTGADNLDWYPAQAQLNTIKRLLRDIKKVYPIKKVYFHKDLAATSCPGRLTKKQVGI